VSQPVLVVAPYLPLRESVEIGPWCLVPASEVKPREVAKAVPLVDLLEAYGVPGSDAGAVAHLKGELIGSPVPDVAAVEPLKWALVYAVLSAQPPFEDKGPPEAPADCALVWGHGFDDPSFTSLVEGGMFTVLRGISLTTRPMEKIARPEHLFIPHGFPALDGERATALYDELANGKILGRRLRRALEWLNFAWTNTASITPDVRIVGLRIAYEALLTIGRKSLTNDLRQRVSALLTPRARKTRRQYIGDFGKPKDEQLTDMAHWFQCFTLLRNEIIHGDTVQQQDRTFEGERHVILATVHLLDLIPRMLVRAGHSKDLLDPRLHRDAIRAIEAAQAG
jgi:hypothetical protein